MNKVVSPTATKPAMSKMRKMYYLRFLGRCLTLAACVVLYFLYPKSFDVLDGFHFFRKFSPLHILWAIWMFDMACQLIPIKKHVPLGSQKLFAQHYRPASEAVKKDALRKYMNKSARSAALVLVLWVAFIGAIGGLYFLDIIDKKILFLFSACFYVCDLICVLFWCPFRLMLKNRCCTTCRIFNWDHMMMFSPLVFIGGFYAGSLMLVALAVLGLWELFAFIHPERFWQGSNKALQCVNCTDKLCTQCCQKQRK